LAKRHHPPAACDLAHCARPAIADLINAHLLFAASALLSRFGYAAVLDSAFVALALILAVPAQGQLYQHLGADCPLVVVPHWRAWWSAFAGVGVYRGLIAQLARAFLLS